MMVLCEPKHVGAAFIILTILRIYGFYNSCALVGQQSVCAYDFFAYRCLKLAPALSPHPLA